jgi:hypothetical protein
MSRIDVTVVEQRKTQWTEIFAALQRRTQELNEELVSIQGQLAQLSGAIQACDVLLAGVETQPEVSTLDNNG